MVERCRGFSFLNKAAHAVLIGSQIRRQDLQSDFAIELRVFQPDTPHPSRPRRVEF